MRAMSTLSLDDRPKFHSDVLVSEFTERDARAIEASVISSAPPVAETKDGVTRETWLTPIRPQQGLGTQAARSDIERPRFVGRPAKGSRPPRVKQSQGEITETSPQRPCPTPLRSGQGRLDLFSFESNPEPNPQNLHRGEANGPPESLSRVTWASTERWVKEQWNDT